MQKLKAAEVKKKNSLEVELLAIPMAYLSPLADSFDFNLSFTLSVLKPTLTLYVICA